MKLHTLARLPAISFAVLLGCIITSVANGVVSLSPDLENQFVKNAELLNPIELVWKRQRKSHLDKSDLMIHIHYPDYAKYDFFAEYVSTYRWQDCMAYELIQGWIVDHIPKTPTEKVKLIPFGAEAACDLKLIYMGTSEQSRIKSGRHPLLTIDSAFEPRNVRPEQQIFQSKYLRAIGYWTPSVSGELGLGAVHTILNLVDDGAKLTSIQPVSVGDDELIELELEQTEKIHSFLFDPERGFAMTRHRETVKASGLTAQVVVCSDFHKVKDRQLWLPRHCQITHYTWPTIFPKCSTEPIVDETLEVVSIGTSRMPLEKFVLKYTTPGTFVSDSSLPEAKDFPDGIVGYRISTNPDSLKDSINAARNKLSPGFSVRSWLVVVNVIVVIFLLGWLLWRRFA